MLYQSKTPIMQLGEHNHNKNRPRENLLDLHNRKFHSPIRTANRIENSELPAWCRVLGMNASMSGQKLETLRDGER